MLRSDFLRSLGAYGTDNSAQNCELQNSSLVGETPLPTLYPLVVGCSASVLKGDNPELALSRSLLRAIKEPRGALLVRCIEASVCLPRHCSNAEAKA